MTLIKDKVDALFQDVLLEPDGRVVDNPITGGRFLKGESGDDSIAYQKHEAELALLAQEWFAFYGPPNAPPLPLSQSDWEDIRHELGLRPVVGFYARSLAMRNWEVHNHPPFEDFARGLMAIDTGLWVVQQRVGPDILKRYPPRALVGMTAGAFWEPPMAEYRHPGRESLRSKQAA